MRSVAADLCARTRCFGCGLDGTWLCRGCVDSLPPASAGAAIPAVASVHCAWGYEGAARKLVLALKLRGQLPAAAPLADGLRDVLHRRGTEATVIGWVPARARDCRVRGFDHAEVIARGIASSLGLEPVPLLERTSVRPDQAGLTRAERKRNLLGAFRSVPIKENVLLVDDLITTGATAEACARSLRAAGSPSVEVAAPCRV
jgi:predicted amidophosphoribosyltransferase